MYVAVFGPDTPREAGPGSFPERVARALEGAMHEPSGMTLLFSEPWMLISFLPHAPSLGCKLETFQAFFKNEDTRRLGLGALNICTYALFVLPHHTVVDEETGHNHPIIDWVAMAFGLDRNILADDKDLLLRRMKKRLEIE